MAQHKCLMFCVFNKYEWNFGHTSETMCISWGELGEYFKVSSLNKRKMWFLWGGICQF